jgi:hypothetical protein
MIRARDENQLNSWFETVAQSGIAEFRNFAEGYGKMKQPCEQR